MITKLYEDARYSVNYHEAKFGIKNFSAYKMLEDDRTFEKNASVSGTITENGGISVQVDDYFEGYGDVARFKMLMDNIFHYARRLKVESEKQEIVV